MTTVVGGPGWGRPPCWPRRWPRTGWRRGRRRVDRGSSRATPRATPWRVTPWRRSPPAPARRGVGRRRGSRGPTPRRSPTRPGGAVPPPCAWCSTTSTCCLRARGRPLAGRPGRRPARQRPRAAGRPVAPRRCRSPGWRPGLVAAPRPRTTCASPTTSWPGSPPGGASTPRSSTRAAAGPPWPSWPPASRATWPATTCGRRCSNRWAPSGGACWPSSPTWAAPTTPWPAPRWASPSTWAVLDGVPLVAQGTGGWRVPHPLWPTAPALALPDDERRAMRPGPSSTW